MTANAAARVLYLNEFGAGILGQASRERVPSAAMNATSSIVWTSTWPIAPIRSRKASVSR